MLSSGGLVLPLPEVHLCVDNLLMEIRDQRKVWDSWFGWVNNWDVPSIWQSIRFRRDHNLGIYSRTKTMGTNEEYVRSTSWLESFILWQTELTPLLWPSHWHLKCVQEGIEERKGNRRTINSNEEDWRRLWLSGSQPAVVGLGLEGVPKQENIIWYVIISRNTKTQSC